MRIWMLVPILLLVAARVAAQPADCDAGRPPAGTLPLSLDLAGRPGVPSGVTGQMEIEVPLASGGRDAVPRCATAAARRAAG